MKKTKHNPPKRSRKKDRTPRFIKFSDVQRGYLTEVRVRQFKEFNAALDSVYEEMGIMEKIREAPPGAYRLRQNDLSGLDYAPLPPPPPPPKDEEKKEEKPEEGKETESKEESGKTH